MILYFSRKTKRCIGTVFGRFHTDEQKAQVLIKPHDHENDDIAVVINEWKPVGKDNNGDTIFEPEYGNTQFWQEVEEGKRSTNDIMLELVDGQEAMSYSDPVDEQPSNGVE